MSRSPTPEHLWSGSGVNTIRGTPTAQHKPPARCSTTTDSTSCGSANQTAATTLASTAGLGSHRRHPGGNYHDKRVKIDLFRTRTFSFRQALRAETSRRIPSTVCLNIICISSTSDPGLPAPTERGALECLPVNATLQTTRSSKLDGLTAEDSWRTADQPSLRRQTAIHRADDPATAYLTFRAGGRPATARQSSTAAPPHSVKRTCRWAGVDINHQRPDSGMEATTDDAEDLGCGRRELITRPSTWAATRFLRGGWAQTPAAPSGAKSSWPNVPLGGVGRLRARIRTVRHRAGATSAPCAGRRTSTAAAQPTDPSLASAG